MSAMQIALPSNATWHAAGLRWIGSLFNQLADYLDRPAAEPMHVVVDEDEYLNVLRHRIESRYY